MNHLPNLAVGVRRSAGPRQRGARGIAAAQSLPVYGNYCGPGHTDPTGCAPAVDEVDAVCCRHDQCYAEHGYKHCKCDCDLVTAMPGAIANSPSVEAKLKGTAIMAFFQSTPCLCFPWGVPVPGGVGCLSPCI